MTRKNHNMLVELLKDKLHQTIDDVLIAIPLKINEPTLVGKYNEIGHIIRMESGEIVRLYWKFEKSTFWYKFDRYEIN